MLPPLHVPAERGVQRLGSGARGIPVPQFAPSFVAFAQTKPPIPSLTHEGGGLEQVTGVSMHSDGGLKQVGGGGGEVLITDVEHLRDALEGREGTRIVASTAA